MIIVSACLLGQCCKYSGGHNLSETVMAYLGGKDYLPFCPEELGGLATPRPPVEIIGGSGEDVLNGTARAVNKTGQDVTAQFIAGARAALALCRENGVDLAILKEQSPSCGVHRIYDGSFGGVKKAGHGVCAALLHEAGIKVISEEDCKYLAPPARPELAPKLAE